MPSQDALCALAVLKANWDERQDYIDLFVPFVAQALREAAVAEVSLQELQTNLNSTFGFRIPQGAVATILNRAVSKGYAHRERGNYRRNDVRLAEDGGFTGRRQAALRQYEHVSTALAEWARRFDIAWTPDDAGTALLKFLRENRATVFGATLGGQPLDNLPDDGAASVIVGSFIRDAHERNPLLFDSLLTVMKGGMLASALLLEGLSEVRRRIINLHVFFDTRFLIQALGFEGDEAAKPCLELVELLHDEHVSLRVFSDTYVELEGVLEGVSNFLANPITRRDNPGRTARYLLETGARSSDVAYAVSQIRNAFGDLGIKLVDRPAYVQSETIDEARLTEELRRIYPGGTREAAIAHDMRVVSAIRFLRSDPLPRLLEDARAIFVTTNRGLAEAARACWNWEFGPTTDRWIPPVLVDGTFTTLVWLKQPNASELPAARLLADCFAAMNPGDQLWQRYLDELQKLHQADEITAAEYDAFRYDPAARNALMDTTLGDVSRLTAGSMVDVLRRAREEIQKEARGEMAAESSARAAAEEAREATIVSQRMGRESRRMKRARVAASIARGVTNVIALATSIAAAVLLGLAAIAAFDPTWGAVGAVAMVPLQLITWTDLMWGISLRNVRAGVSRTLARQLEDRLAEWFDAPDE